MATRVAGKTMMILFDDDFEAGVFLERGLLPVCFIGLSAFGLVMASSKIGSEQQSEFLQRVGDTTLVSPSG